ncbi:MAG: hypothetical protein HY958_01390 [Bacteroidia bacterium]|nr:hypothetical protein [Bacteroidia bacterium]
MKVTHYIFIFILLFSTLRSFSQEKKSQSDSLPKTLEEIYRESREKEGPVVIPPQIAPDYLKKIGQMASKKEIGRLLDEFKKYQVLAKKNPGSMKHGNIILGAPDDKYFAPSEETNRLSEIGNRISEFVSYNRCADTILILIEKLIQSNFCPLAITYNRTSYHHIDVVGSGRFVYPNPSEKKTINLTENLTLNLFDLKKEKIKELDYLIKELKVLTEKNNKNFLKKLSNAFK